jgi:hypothetical protein
LGGGGGGGVVVVVVVLGMLSGLFLDEVQWRHWLL